MDKHILFQEFRRVLYQHELSPTAQAVVVLSGHPARDSKGNVISEYSSENIARIAFGIQTAQIMRNSFQKIFSGDGPYLVLNGDERQLGPMEEIATGLGFPSVRMIIVNSGKREASNTRTQFEMLNSDPVCKHFRDVIFVTHDYHALRVALTAKKHLPTDCHYVILSVPNGYNGFSYNMFRVLREEINKIQEYADRGDIANFL